ncbi:hypothetical protein D9M72_540970 [compost metagenome]
MIGKCAIGPFAFLLEHDDGRAGAPFLAAEQVVGRSRDQEGRPHTPDDPAFRRLGRREKEALQRIAEAELRAARAGDVVLRRHRQNGSRNDVPVRVQRKGDDRLDVDGRLVAVIRAVAVVVIELEGNADQRGNRV